MTPTRTTKEKATDEFKEKVDGWARHLRVKPVRVRVQQMTRKWGSCSTTGWVTFAQDLLGTSSALQDYVILHELLHLKVPNHGRLFKSYQSTLK
jgi:Predicted metal-dependent hydrolase